MEPENYSTGLKSFKESSDVNRKSESKTVLDLCPINGIEMENLSISIITIYLTLMGLFSVQ